MAGIRSPIGLLKAIGRISWRDAKSFRSIAGQNLFLFLIFVALQPESAYFFLLLLILIMLFPLSSDPMHVVPEERRMSWPLSKREWVAVRLGSWALSPISWVALTLLLTAGWGGSALVVAVTVAIQFFRRAATFLLPAASTSWLRWLPKPPGVIGSIMRLQWRTMLQTLDPYVALALMASTVAYKATGRHLDPAASRILSLVVVLAMSTQTQVLFGLDGCGIERYRQMPIRGWQILLAKDLAFLVLLSLLVFPLDLFSGMVCGSAMLAIGHHRSVLQPRSQMRWRFTSGALVPDGIVQIAVLFAVGNAVHALPGLSALCCAGWLGSIFIYGWQWDRRRVAE